MEAFFISEGVDGWLVLESMFWSVRDVFFCFVFVLGLCIEFRYKDEKKKG